MLTKEDLLKPEHFALNIFKEKGFSRQVCKKCNHGFWSIKERQTCGDASCVSYEFIGNPVMPALTWKQARQKFLDFFKKGHTFVKRYPVVARWKPDTLFTGAGVFNYMPWVLKGIAEPPANPALTDQPSVRFVDIDNVGLGTGRHCTEFSMLGHHVFNKDKEIYWKEKAVRLAYELFTGEFKIPADKITFAESLWQGGGNAGPCFEIHVDGNEIGTLVFMQFEQVGDQYKEMDMKVVDPGYGLERIVWASQGTPTIYDSIYPKVIDWLKKEANVKTYDKKVFEEFCRLSAGMNVEDVNVEEQRKIIVKEISKKFSITEDEIMEQIFPMHHVYRVCDHAKALAFILGDYVVPSNIQEGYLARLLIRRAIYSLHRLGLDIELGSVVEKQIKEIADVYPELEKRKDIILSMVETEEQKYKNNIKNAKASVKKFQELLLRSGKKKFDKKNFVMMYESRGLNPEIVKANLDMPSEEVTTLEIREEIRKNLIKEEEQKSGLGDYKVENKLAFLEDLPNTEKLEDLEFKASVLKILDNLVILDKSGFYPRSGGAEPDHGYIGEAKVIDVEQKSGVIVHTVDRSVGLKDRSMVLCKINKDRRDQISRHHTGAHIVNGAARRVLGQHMWQRGAKKDADKAHLDMTHYKPITEKELQKIEKVANDLVKKKVKVEKLTLDRTAAEQRFGFRIYQGGVAPGRELKIINIPRWDVEACGGIHKDNTSEVGKIIITKLEKPHDGVVRFIFRAGPAAEEWEHNREKILKECLEILNIKKSSALPAAVKKLFTKWKTLRKRLEKKKKKEAAKLAKKIKPEKVGSINLIVTEVPGAGMRQLQEMSRQISTENTFVVLFGISEKIFVFCSAGKNVNINAGLITSKICSDLGGKGGGSPTLGQGFGVNKEKLAEVKKKIKKELIV